jgi:hypothetical protein
LAGSPLEAAGICPPGLPAPQPALSASFAATLRKDWAAVTAGMTLAYSSGAVEGHVNHKMIKSQLPRRYRTP